MEESNPTKKAARTPCRSDVYQFFSLVAGLFLVWQMWSAFHLPMLLVFLLGLNIALAASARSIGLMLVTLGTYLFVEWRVGLRATALESTLCGFAMLLYTALHLRFHAAIDRSEPPPQPRTWWQLATAPIRQLFKSSPILPDRSPIRFTELVRLIIALIVAGLFAWIWWRYSPQRAVFSLELPVRTNVMIAIAMLIPAFILVFVIRSIWIVFGRERPSPLAAELQLNDEVWSELRPDLDRMGKRLGAAADKQPKLSEP